VTGLWSRSRDGISSASEANVSVSGGDHLDLSRAHPCQVAAKPADLARMLSQPWHGSKDVQPVPKAVYHSISMTHIQTIHGGIKSRDLHTAVVLSGMLPLDCHTATISFILLTLAVIISFNLHLKI